MNSSMEKRRWGFETFYFLQIQAAHNLMGQIVTQEEWEKTIKEKIHPLVAYHLYTEGLLSEEEFRRIYPEAVNLLEVELSLPFVKPPAPEGNKKGTERRGELTG